MKRFFLLVSTGTLSIILGCSRNSPTDLSKSASSVVQASGARVSPSPASEAAELPVPSVVAANQQGWRSENVKDLFGTAVALTHTSIDGKFDLVILQKGMHCFLSFVRHERWGSVYNQQAKGKLMYLRVKFEDGQERRVEWDELGFATENLYSVLWSYPVKADTSLGPALGDRATDSVGGDELLIQDMMKHKTMLLEVEAGATTQFDLTGLAQELEKVRTSQTRTILEARQNVE